MQKKCRCGPTDSRRSLGCRKCHVCNRRVAVNEWRANLRRLPHPWRVAVGAVWRSTACLWPCAQISDTVARPFPLPTSAHHHCSTAMTDMRALLHALTVPDTRVVLQATAAIRDEIKEKRATAPLLSLLSDSEATIRQLAAVLLRRVVPDRAPHFSLADVTASRAAVLTALVNEQVSTARSAQIALAAVLAQWTMPGAVTPAACPWPDVLAAALSARQFSLQLVCAMAENCAKILLAEPQRLLETLSAALDARAPRCVRAYAAVLRAASVESSDLFKTIIALLPKLIDTVKALAAHDAASDEFARVAADTFECCQFGAESSGDAMRAYFSASIALAVEMFRGRNAANEARAAAAEYLMFAAVQKPRSFRKLAVVPAMLTAFCEIAAEFRVPDSVDDEPEEEQLPCDVALRVLDIMAKRPELTNSVFTAVVSAATALLECAKQDTTSVDRDSHSAAAFRIMGVVAEGCAVSISMHAGDIVTKISEGVLNPTLGPHARSNALSSLGLVCECLETDEMQETLISSVGGVALSAIVGGMRDTVLQVRRSACASLEAVLALCLLDSRTLGPRIAQIISAVGSLGADAAVEAVMAIGVLADNVPEEFVTLKSMPDLIRATLSQMSRTDQDGLEARTAATDTAGALCAVVEDHSVIEQFAATAVMGLAIDEPSVKRATYGFFARMADTVGANVVVAYGSRVLAAALESIKRDDVVFEPEDDESAGGLQGLASAIADKDGEQEENENANGTFSVRTSLLDEKMLAVAVHGAFASASCSSEYVEAVKSVPQVAKEVQAFLKEASECIDQLTMYFHEEIRAAAQKTGMRFALANLNLAKFCPQLVFDDSDVISTSLQRLVYCITEDTDRWVVEAVLHSIVVLLDEVPPAEIASRKAILISALDALIKGDTMFQCTEDDVDLDAADGEIGEDISGIASGICDFAEALVRNQRGMIAREMSYIFESLMKNMFNSSVRNRAVVFGATTGVLLFLNFDRCTKFTPPAPGSKEFKEAMDITDAVAAEILPHALDAVAAKKGMTIQRNSLFLVGLVFSRASARNQAVWSNLQRAIALMQEHLLEPKSRDNAPLIDNAAGAVSRIMTAPGLRPGALGNRSAALQLLLGAIPMQGDPQENVTVARAIIFVAESEFQAILPFIEPVVSCLTSAMLLALAQRKEDQKPKRWTGERLDRDENDAMVRLDNEECEKISRVLIQIRAQYGDAPFNSLGLAPNDAAELASVISTQK